MVQIKLVKNCIKMEKEPKIELDRNLEGMRFFEGHPICKEYQTGIHNHPIDRRDRADCKNIGKIESQTFQCHCGFGGICKNGEWLPWSSRDQNNKLILEAWLSGPERSEGGFQKKPGDPKPHNFLIESAEGG